MNSVMDCVKIILLSAFLNTFILQGLSKKSKDNFTDNLVTSLYNFLDVRTTNGQHLGGTNMSKQQNATGVYQLKNGNWGFRFTTTVNGSKKSQRRVQDENGNPFTTQKKAIKAREIAIAKFKVQQEQLLLPKQKKQMRMTVKEIFEEYCKYGRNEKAYTTKLKQDSLWKNHLCDRFGNKYIDEISLAEIQDYLAELYYIDCKAYTYVESFLKMFYLIYGQAYSRDYIDVDLYNKMCVNKDSKIHMPKIKSNEETDIVYFDKHTLYLLDNYFSGTNAETAYMLGRYCGLRINECYGLKWENVDLENGIITIDRQMQYQNGLIKLVPLKTKNANRKIYMNQKLKSYLTNEKKQQEKDSIEQEKQRQQNQTIIEDINGEMIFSLDLVNCLPNGKIQTVNSMKFHSRTLQGEHNIMFKYHYLRHTYGTTLAILNTPEHLLCNQMGHCGIHITHKYYIALSKEGIDTLKENLNLL